MFWKSYPHLDMTATTYTIRTIKSSKTKKVLITVSIKSEVRTDSKIFLSIVTWNSNVVGKTVVDKVVGGSDGVKTLSERQTKLEIKVKSQQSQIDQLRKDIKNRNGNRNVTEKQCLNYQATAKTIRKGDGSIPKGQYLLIVNCVPKTALLQHIAVLHWALIFQTVLKSMILAIKCLGFIGSSLIDQVL